MKHRFSAKALRFAACVLGAAVLLVAAKCDGTLDTGEVWCKLGTQTFDLPKETCDHLQGTYTFPN